jgi:hypothetical protein
MKKKKLSRYKRLYAEEEALTMFLYDSISPNIPFSKLPEDNQNKIRRLGKLVKKIRDDSTKYKYIFALSGFIQFLKELKRSKDLLMILNNINQKIKQLEKEIKNGI